MTSLGEKKERAKASSTFAAALVGILLAACLAVVGLTWLSLVRSRAQYQMRAEITAQNLCGVLGDNLANSYEKIDLALQAVRDEVERQSAAGALDGPGLERFIERVRVRIPILDGLRTVDAQGVIRHGTGVAPGSCIDVSDRDFFLRLREGKDPGLVIATPVQGRVTGKWVISLARRIHGPDGSFGGVVQGAIALEQLTRIFSTLDLGRDGTISLRGPDLAIIARHPEPMGPGSFLGQRVISSEFQALLKAGRSRGTYTAQAVVDGVHRIYAFRELQGHGQYILVGLGEREALAGWHREVLQTLAFAGLFLALILCGSWLVHRAWRRQRAAADALAEQEAKYRSIFEHASEGIFQIEMDGPIRSLNPAFARICGYASPEEMRAVVSRPEDLDWARREDRERLKTALLETGRIADFEVEFHRRDGTSVWVLINAHLIPGAEGEARIYEGTATDITERKRAEMERERLILALQSSQAEVNTLSGLFPICSNCKKIRDDKGYWNQIETYIASHSDVDFTHGICPDCARELFSEVFERRASKSERDSEAERRKTT